ncbi:MAG: hypothetical protein QG609_41 [Patescibacteria group bacterium]|nr:hypothetical protein [Patescibacteria group bacterium]
MTNDDIQKDRLRAQMAMSNKDRVESNTESKNDNKKEVVDNLEQKKVEARKAMESKEHKEAREKREAEIEAIRLHEQKIIEIRHKRELLEKQKSLEETQSKEQLSKKNIEEENKYQDELKKASSIIENIKNNEPSISPLRTLKTDQSPILTESKNISATIRPETINEINVPNQSSWLKILVIIFIFILVISSVFILYTVNKKTITIQTGVPTENIASLIPVNTNVKINVDNKTPANIISLIKSQLRPSVTGPSLQQIYFESLQTDAEGNKNTKRLETIDFLSVTNISLPADFIHFLQPEYMVASFADINTPASISIILTTRSFEHTYAKLLDSESDILSLLYKDFLTPDQISNIKNTDFIDKTINNIDTRGIYTNEGELVIMYSFINPKFLVITTNIESFNAIINSYRQSNNN